ncbi:hypothetical protein SAY86_032001 [Trapa natans]|uniref:Uncharacterized protein n=1 Tax=Trapa natans TaxID=22666 RepID=A0AAN7M4N1_TRANT|nr:hypothetical protein SAY86_032001 [Trapa natans]
MTSLSKKIRSISLPARSHPSTCPVEQELCKLRSWESAPDFSSSGFTLVRTGLSGIEKLYTCMDDLLGMGSTQQLLSRHHRHVNELLDMSVTILDVCGTTRDLVSQVKEHVRELESAVRRRKAGSSMETTSADYANMRRKMKKDARRLMDSLRQQTDSRVYIMIPTETLPCDQQHLAAVVRVIREVNSSSISVLRSVLVFLSVSGPRPASGQSRWSAVSRLMLKGRGAVENEPQKSEALNEFELVGAAMGSMCLMRSGNKEAMRVLQKRFEELEIGIGAIEDGLEGMRRRLVKARATLLNIIVH